MVKATVGPIKKVAFISSYLPKKCGIATFTSDLISNMQLAGGTKFQPVVFAIDSGNQPDYNEPVEFTITKESQYDYIAAADYMNSSDIDVVSLQHEFGLFGGPGGSYINLLLKRLNKPVVTTLHTILEKPAAEYFDSLIDVCSLSDSVVVMNTRGIRMLREIYSVPESKIKLIPHGIPDLPFTSSHGHKKKLGLSGRKTILTFGLLSRNKGIEVMLKASPTIVKAEPSVLYIVLGATHPEVRRLEGQSYENALERMVTDLGLEKNVVFHNRFVNDDELFEFLGAADVYVTPYLHKEQLTSGTLAFAVGTGRAVVSTGYWAAEELLAEGRGKLVRFNDSAHIARSIVEIFGNDSLFFNMKRQAYNYGRSMTWPKIGQAYRQFFDTVASWPPVSLEPQVDSPRYRTTVSSRSANNFAMRA